MLFSSMEFVLFFFPVVFIVYYILPLKGKNYWLLLTSLFFYAWGDLKFVAGMLFSIVLNYALALRIEELREKPAEKKAILIVAIVVDIGMLFVFKYLNFITATLHRWLPATSIALPLGISFFTFQALSYVIDVYRGAPAEKNLTHFGLYISMFPQLIQGPIVRYGTVRDQITSREIPFDRFTKGLLRFFVGFNKKVLMANVLSQLADAAYSSIPQNSVGMAWLGAIGYSLQIYFDFSGYSDMALGLGQMLGFTFLENFDYPYISKTITEFWRRWHISLGTWFRDYVYFPLGGSRVKSKSRLVLNLFVVWLLTGIWHGANWTFILWGVLYGVLLTFEKLLDIPKKIEKAPRPLRALNRLFVLVMVVCGWVIFRSENLSSALLYLRSMFGLLGNPLGDQTSLFYAREYAVYLILGIVFSMPVFPALKEKISAGGGKHSARSESLVSICEGLGACIQIVLFIVSVSFLVMDAHNPFIYFNF